LKSSGYYRPLALHAWNIAAVGALLVVFAVAWKLLTPVGVEVYSSAKTLLAGAAMLGKADSIALLPEQTRRQADGIDSSLRAIASIPKISEQLVPGIIYTLANQAGIKASKVEISGMASSGKVTEIPVTFRGAGDYDACGKFIDGVENMRPAGKIRELSMKNADKGSVDLFVDFAIVSQQ
jgi:hypothetical protein